MIHEPSAKKPSDVEEDVGKKQRDVINCDVWYCSSVINSPFGLGNTKRTWLELRNKSRKIMRWKFWWMGSRTGAFQLNMVTAIIRCPSRHIPVTRNQMRNIEWNLTRQPGKEQTGAYSFIWT